MIEHLSAEQISQWMIGDRTPAVEQHVAECPACSAELAQLESTISQFRSAMRESAASTAIPEWREPAPRASWLAWPRLALTAAALILLVTIPISWRVRVEQQTAREQAARTMPSSQAELSDAQLLESVDSEISQAVPGPMEPLVPLVTWNSASAEQNQKSQRQ